MKVIYWRRQLHFLMRGLAAIFILTCIYAPLRFNIFLNSKDFQKVPESYFYPIGECQDFLSPRKHIFYVKVHKTGSTSLRSIFLLYGRKYNLTICMDSVDMWGLNWPYNIDPLRMTKPLGAKCDIVAEELVYDREMASELMPKNAILITSIRNPVQHFLSLFKYARIWQATEHLVGKSLDEFDAMRTFFKYPKLIQKVISTYDEKEMRDTAQINLIRPNLQLYDLGFDKWSQGIQLNMNSEDIYKEFVKFIRKEFHHIVMSEYFTESMVLLRRKLCCPFQDVFYRDLNARRSAAEKKKTIPKDIMESIINFNQGDMILYEMVNRSMWQDIKRDWAEFGKEISSYRASLSIYETYCRNGSIPESTRLKKCPPIIPGDTGAFLKPMRDKEKAKVLTSLQKLYHNKKYN